MIANRRLLLAALLVVSAGCSGSGVGGAAGVRPLAVAGRSGISGGIEDDGVGAEAAYVYSESWMDVQVVLAHHPMRTKAGDAVGLNTADVVLLVIGPPAGERSPGFYTRGGFGASLLFMDFSEGHDMGGAGLSARAAAGCRLNKHLRFEVFGDARGWLGLDAEGDRAAWAAGLGFSVVLLF